MLCAEGSGGAQEIDENDRKKRLSHLASISQCPRREMNTRLLSTSILILGLASAACERERAPTSPGELAAKEKTTATEKSAAAAPAVDPAAKAEAEQIFATRCTPCHGSGGGGDGPASAGLTPKPRNLRDSSWQTTVDDAYLEKIIQYGGAAVGKSPMMPANPDLAGRPVVAALRNHVRSLGK
jgi:mono/diheme cytochrome c family protein